MDAKTILFLYCHYFIELYKDLERPKQATFKVWIYFYICTILSKDIFSNFLILSTLCKIKLNLAF